MCLIIQGTATVLQPSRVHDPCEGSGGASSGRSEPLSQKQGGEGGAGTPRAPRAVIAQRVHDRG